MRSDPLTEAERVAITLMDVAICKRCGQRKTQRVDGLCQACFVALQQEGGAPPAPDKADRPTEGAPAIRAPAPGGSTPPTAAGRRRRGPGIPRLAGETDEEFAKRRRRIHNQRYLARRNLRQAAFVPRGALPPAGGQAEASASGGSGSGRAIVPPSPLIAGISALAAAAHWLMTPDGQRALSTAESDLPLAMVLAFRPGQNPKGELR